MKRRRSRRRSSEPNFRNDDPLRSPDTSSDDYFLFCPEEKEFMDSVAPLLISECLSGNLSWENPDPMMDFLRRAIQEDKKASEINLPTHEKYLQDMLAFIHNKAEETSAERRRAPTPTPLTHAGAGRKTSTIRKAAAAQGCAKKPAKRNVVILRSASPDSGAGTLSKLKGMEMSEKPKPKERHNGETSKVETPANVLGRENDVVFVMKRELNKSDMCPHQQRISMPCAQVASAEAFLTAEERQQLDRKMKIPIKLLDPAGREYHAELSKTIAGSSTYSYVIRKPWNDIKHNNRFQLGMVLDIFARRGDDNELCIVLKRVGRYGC